MEVVNTRNHKHRGELNIEVISMVTVTKKNFYLHFLKAIMKVRMVPPVLPRNFAALRENFLYFKMSHEKRTKPCNNMSTALK